MQGDHPCRIAFNDGLQTSRCTICLRVGGTDLVETCPHRPVVVNETASRETQAPLPSTGETLSEALAYRSAASAFLASKRLIGEFDAWRAEGD